MKKSGLDSFKPLKVNEEHKVILDDTQWMLQVPNILPMVEILKL